MIPKNHFGDSIIPYLSCDLFIVNPKQSLLDNYMYGRKMPVKDNSKLFQMFICRLQLFVFICLPTIVCVHLSSYNCL